MKLKKSLRTIVLFWLVTNLISACTVTGTSKPTRFYQLEQITDPSLTGVEQGSVIGVGPIRLPEYINRPQIVTRSQGHQLMVSEFERWIEPLNENIKRLLVINLSNALQSNRIYWIPRADRDFPLEYRVAIDVGRFDGKLGGSVLLEARWTIFNANDQVMLTRVSLINSPTTGASYEALVSAMDQALKIFGEEISNALKGFIANAHQANH